MKSKKVFEKITSVYLYLLVSLFLLFVGSNGYQGMPEAKFSAFLWICGGYIIVFVLTVLELLTVGDLKFSSPMKLVKKASPMQWCVIAYMAFTWISAFASEHFSITVVGATRYEGALTISVYCITFLFVSIYGKATKGLLFTFATSTFLMSALSIFQLYGANPFALFPSGYNYFDAGKAYSGAYLGTIGNVDIVAAFYCIAIPILLISFFAFKQKSRFLLVLPLVASLYVFFKMFVLAGMVGLLVGAVFALPIVLRTTKKGTVAYFLAILFFVAAFLTVLYFCDIGDGFLHEIHTILHGNIDPLFGSGRIHIWRLVLEKIPSQFFFGTGPDTMGLEDIQAFTRYDEVLGVQLISNVDIAHSEYLNVLYHQGAFGLIAYLLILVCAIVKWVKSKSNFVCVMLGAAVVCYAVQACFSFSMCITAPYFWMALALLEKESQNV